MQTLLRAGLRSLQTLKVIKRNPLSATRAQAQYVALLFSALD